MSLENFRTRCRWKDAWIKKDIAQASWEQCCKWFLEICEKYEETWDKSISSEVKKELGITDIKLPKAFALEDGCRPLCHTLCEEGQRFACYANREPLRDCAKEKAIEKLIKENIDKNVNLAGDDEEHECRFSLSCKRDCCKISGKYCWLAPGDGHRGQGWVPCDEFIPKNIVYHCGWLIKDGKCAWVTPGQEPESCKGYENCDKYYAGEDKIE